MKKIFLFLTLLTLFSVSTEAATNTYSFANQLPDGWAYKSSTGSNLTPYFYKSTASGVNCLQSKTKAAYIESPAFANVSEIKLHGWADANSTYLSDFCIEVQYRINGGAWQTMPNPEEYDQNIATMQQYNAGEIDYVKPGRAYFFGVGKGIYVSGSVSVQEQTFKVPATAQSGTMELKFIFPFNRAIGLNRIDIKTEDEKAPQKPEFQWVDSHDVKWTNKIVNITYTDWKDSEEVGIDILPNLSKAADFPEDLDIRYRPNQDDKENNDPDTDIAYYDERQGKIILGGHEGVVTITASTDGNDDWEACEASFTISVSLKKFKETPKIEETERGIFEIIMPEESTGILKYYHGTAVDPDESEYVVYEGPIEAFTEENALPGVYNIYAKLFPTAAEEDYYDPSLPAELTDVYIISKFELSLKWAGLSDENNGKHEINKDEEYTLPVLTKTPTFGHLAEPLNIIYTSSKPGVADFDEDGDLIIKRRGVTEIKAEIPHGDEIYSSTSATYTLSVLSNDPYFKKVTETSSLKNNDKLLIVAHPTDNHPYYAAGQRSLSGNYLTTCQVENDISAANQIEAANEAVIFTLHPSATDLSADEKNVYTLEGTTGYLKFLSTDNGVTTVALSEVTDEDGDINDACKFIIEEIAGTNDHMLIRPILNTDLTIRFNENASPMRFIFAANDAKPNGSAGNRPIYIYRQNYTNPDLKWMSGGTQMYDLYATLATTSEDLPVLVFEKHVQGTQTFTPKIVYSSSNPEVAEIDATGKITIKAKGNTVITAEVKGADEDIHFVYSYAEFTLHVAEAIMNDPTVTINDETKTFTITHDNETGVVKYYVDPTEEVINKALIEEKGIVYNEGEEIAFSPVPGKHTVYVCVYPAEGEDGDPSGIVTAEYSVAKYTATLEWSAQSKSILLEDGSWTFPTLTTSAELPEGFEAPIVVTYTSSNPKVATIDAEGNITVIKRGTTDITAEIESGDANYNSVKASYDLTVKSDEPTFDRIETTGDLREGDEIVFSATENDSYGYNYYIMGAPNATKSYRTAPAVNVEVVTINGITTYSIGDPDEGTVFTLVATGDEAYPWAFKSNSTGLYLQGSATGRTLNEATTITDLCKFQIAVAEDGSVNARAKGATNYIRHLSTGRFELGSLTDGNNYFIYSKKLIDPALRWMRSDGEVATTANAIISKEEQVLPTLKMSDRCKGRKVPVVYTSSNPEIAAIDDAGNITISENVGTTIITAEVIGDDKIYIGSKASYELSVGYAYKNSPTITIDEEAGTFSITHDNETGILMFYHGTQFDADKAVSERAEYNPEETHYLNTDPGTYYIHSRVWPEDGEENVSESAPATVKYIVAQHDGTLAWSATDVTVGLVDEVKIFPELIKSAEDMNVTFSSSNTLVATVDKEGNVTVLRRGTAVITAEVKEGDNMYKPVQAQYTLNVTSLVPAYKLVTDVAELKTNDNVIIVAKTAATASTNPGAWLAMGSSYNGTAAYRHVSSGTMMMPAGDESVIYDPDLDGASIFILEKTDDGRFAFKGETTGRYLKVVNPYLQTVAKDDLCYFTITIDSDVATINANNGTIRLNSSGDRFNCSGGYVTYLYRQELHEADLAVTDAEVTMNLNGPKKVENFTFAAGAPIAYTIEAGENPEYITNKPEEIASVDENGVVTLEGKEGVVVVKAKVDHEYYRTTEASYVLTVNPMGIGSITELKAIDMNEYPNGFSFAFSAKLYPYARVNNTIYVTDDEKNDKGENAHGLKMVGCDKSVNENFEYVHLYEITDFRGHYGLDDNGRPVVTCMALNTTDRQPSKLVGKNFEHGELNTFDPEEHIYSLVTFKHVTYRGGYIYTAENAPSKVGMKRAAIGEGNGLKVNDANGVITDSHEGADVSMTGTIDHDGTDYTFVPTSVQDSMTGIANIFGDEEGVYVVDGSIIAPEGTEIYNAAGMRVAGQNVTKGIYVIRLANGKTAKVLVK